MTSLAGARAPLSYLDELNYACSYIRYFTIDNIQTVIVQNVMHMLYCHIKRRRRCFDCDIAEMDAERSAELESFAYCEDYTDPDDRNHHDHCDCIKCGALEIY